MAFPMLGKGGEYDGVYPYSFLGPISSNSETNGCQWTAGTKKLASYTRHS